MSKDRANIDPRIKVLLMSIRQALLIALGALEDYLGTERSVTPKHKRDKRDSR